MPHIKIPLKRRIADHAASGEDLHAIAADLGLTPRTIRKYADTEKLLQRAPLFDRHAAEKGVVIGNLRHALADKDQALIRSVIEQTPKGATVADLIVACACDQMYDARA